MEEDPKQTPVEVKDLCKSFGDQRVLNGISLSVPGGRTLAVLGRSGTGKSVLLKLLVGLQSPDSGSVWIAGQDMNTLDAEGLNRVRKGIGFLFQQAALYDSLSVEDNVAFPLTRHTTLTESGRKDKVRELLSTVGLHEGDFGKMPSEISGGMQKRAGLARALALDPAVLLLDEPTAGLDPITAAEIGNLIVKLKETRGITGVVVTHDIRGARTFSDDLALLNDGDVVAQGSYDDLRKNKDEFATRFFGNRIE